MDSASDLDGTAPRRKRILGHLAQFGSFSSQGEVLCTQGLAFILRDPGASSALAAEIARRTGIELSSDLTWRAEVRQESDGGRPDLEAIVDGVPIVKVEAKLGAALSEGQLMSYCADLHGRSGTGALLVLCPKQRMDEAENMVSRVFERSAAGRWHSADHPGVAVGVASWEELFEALSDVEAVQEDLAQLEDMYKVLTGHDIVPFASHDDLVRWRERESDLVNIVDRVTRDLTTEHRVYPMGVETLLLHPEGLETKGYHRRYFCRSMGDKMPCFSIGLRDPFKEHTTPIWLRVHGETPGYQELHKRLHSSGLACQLVPSGGNMWFPLEVPLDAGDEEMVKALIDQANELLGVALPPLASEDVATDHGS